IPLDDFAVNLDKQTFWSALAAPSARERIQADHPVLLSWMTDAVAAARVPEAQQEAAFAALENRVRAERGRGPPAASGAPSVAVMVPATLRSKAQLRCLVVALAAERYRLAVKAWPDSLECLTPDYLAAAPLDPYDGQPLRFRRTDTGVVVYSVGPDR